MVVEFQFCDLGHILQHTAYVGAAAVALKASVLEGPLVGAVVCVFPRFLVLSGWARIKAFALGCTRGEGLDGVPVNGESAGLPRVDNKSLIIEMFQVASESVSIDQAGYTGVALGSHRVAFESELG